MRKFLLSMFLILLISFSAKSQCPVTISPQGTTTFCEGDSVVLVASGSGDSVMLDQSQTVYNAGTSARNLPGYSYWQSFEAGMTGTLSQIDIGFFTYINGTGYLTIWDGEGTSGTELDSQVVTVYCSGGNCLLSFPMSIPVSAGNEYTFQIRGGPGMPDPYGIQVASPNYYTNGVMGFVDPSGTYLTDFDMVFNTWVSQSGVSYVWSTGETDSAITVTSGGTYTVTITTSLGCIDSTEEEVTVNPLPIVGLIIKNDTVCVSDLPVILSGTPAGGVYSGSNVLNDQFIPSSPGLFTVTYTYTDSNGCTNSISKDILVEVCLTVPALDNNNSLIKIQSLSNSGIVVNADNSIVGSEFYLYDVFGKVIISSAIQNGETFININRNSSGIYLYIIKIGTQTIASSKIIIEK